MRFDLTDMRLFLTVIEQGSLTRGAAALNLALASVSERISGMEAVLGAPLLDRNRRGVTTTPAGDAFAQHARQILYQVEVMRGDLRSYGGGMKGQIRLLSNTAGLVDFLPPGLRSFLTDNPDLSVHLSERPSSEIALAVAGGRADMGVVADSTDLSGVQTRTISQDQLVVFTSRSHALSGLRSVNFSTVIGEPFVGLSDTALETHLAEHAARLGRQISYRIKFRRVGSIGMMVEAGIGVAILPESSAAEMQQYALSSIPLSDPWALRHLYLCAKNFDSLAPIARLLAEYLAAEPVA